MKTLLTIVLVAFSILSFAQTDIIEMRSRNTSLKYNERNAKPEHGTSNFGMLPPDNSWRAPDLIEISSAVLDSVKCLSDSVAIMYTSRNCSESLFPEPRIGAKWNPGADTVVNHPLFSQRHSLDSVKVVLDRDYWFKLPSDSTKFIGFDNNQEISNEDAVLPVKHNHEKKNSFGWELIFMLVTPILFLLGFTKFVMPKSFDSE